MNKTTASDTGVSSPPDFQELHDAQLRFADAQQPYITTYIQLADTKCAWAFAASAALVAYLLTNSTSSPVLGGGGLLASRCFGYVSLGLLITSSVCAFLGIAPRLASTRSTDPFFFGTVAGHKHSTDFINQVTRLEFADLIAVRLRHNYDISRVCARKYEFVKASLWIGFAGACCLGLALLINAVRDAPKAPAVLHQAGQQQPRGLPVP